MYPKQTEQHVEIHSILFEQGLPVSRNAQEKAIDIHALRVECLGGDPNAVGGFETDQSKQSSGD